MNGGLECLGNASGERAAALDLGKRAFGNGRSPLLGQAEYRTKDARGSDRILNGEIDTDSTDRRHGVSGIADAEQAGNMPPAQAVDLDRKEGHLIPGLYLVGARSAVGAGCAEEGNEAGQILPEGLQAGGFDVGFEAVLSDDVTALEVVLPIDHDDHATVVEVSQGGFRIVGPARKTQPQDVDGGDPGKTEQSGSFVWGWL